MQWIIANWVEIAGVVAICIMVLIVYLASQRPEKPRGAHGASRGASERHEKDR